MLRFCSSGVQILTLHSRYLTQLSNVGRRLVFCRAPYVMDFEPGSVVSEHTQRRYKRHSCLASAHFDAPMSDVRQAIVESAGSLKGFSLATESFDEAADIEVAYHTPAGWLDVLSFYLRSIPGHAESTEIVCFSRSTNLCPDRPPWSVCRCCCSGMRLFSDGGQNRLHVTAIVDQMEQMLKLPSFLEIHSASK